MITEFQGEYRWLSNFWFTRVHLDGMEFPSVEHAYQAAKTLKESERLALRFCSPGEAKRSSRHFTLRRDWSQIKLKVMEDLLRQKFAHEDLKQRLLETGDEHLQEGNRWGDTYWGVDLRTGKGDNHLGALLVKIRREIREGSR